MSEPQLSDVLAELRELRAEFTTLRDQPQHPPSTLTEPMLFLVVTRYAPPASSQQEHSQEEQRLSPLRLQSLRHPAHSMATQR
jgi:hypothetical protein